MLPQKHKCATKFVYKSGFFITTNELPDFGSSRDTDAVYKRLAIFQTKSLKEKDTRVSS